MAATATALVERFYNDVWNKADEDVAREILAADFVFHASLGPELRGRDGFIAYLRSVHAALENFVCIIEDVIATEHKAAAKMLFRGRHRGKLFGVEATGRNITWRGAAFFTVSGGAITALWVLGDIDAVKRQLMPGQALGDFTL